MLQQGCNIAYLNNTQENWEGGCIGGEGLEQKELEEREERTKVNSRKSLRKEKNGS
jgi:hypothetical protein